MSPFICVYCNSLSDEGEPTAGDFGMICAECVANAEADDEAWNAEELS